MKYWLSIALCFLTTFGNCATFGQTTPPVTSSDSNPNIEYFKAQSTPATSGTLTSITLLKGNIGAGTGNLAVALYTDNGGSPSKPSVLVSSTVVGGGALTTTPATVTTNLTATITAGTQYWFAVAAAGSFTSDIGFEFDNVSNNFCYLGGESSFPATAGACTDFAEGAGIFGTYTPNATTGGSNTYLNIQGGKVVINGAQVILR